MWDPGRHLGDSIELLRPDKSVVLGSNPSDCRKAVIAQSVVHVNALYARFQMPSRVDYAIVNSLYKWGSAETLDNTSAELFVYC